MRRKSRTWRENFLIVVDGETEVWYFQMLRRNEKNLQVRVEPKIPQKKEFSEQFEDVKGYSKDYTKVFWIIDVDDIIAKSKLMKKGKTNKIQMLKENLKELEKEEYKNVVTILNNPCLEFWFLLHFKQTTKYFPKCGEAEKELKTHIKDYQKNRKYFTKENNDIYSKLKPHLSAALSNAQRVQRKNLDEIEQAICEMNLFFETKQIKNAIGLEKN